MRTLLILALLVPFGASAQGFANNDMGTCYSWNGGNHSSGSFIKCNPELQPIKKAVVPAPLAAAPTPAPMVVPMQSCPPIEVKPRPKVMKKRPPPVKC
jgi:hypothetical protein